MVTHALSPSNRLNLFAILPGTLLAAWPVDSLMAQPVIADNGVTNAASYSALRAPGAGIAPGSIFIVFGTGLGPETLQSSPGYPLRTELAGTTIRIGETPAYMLYTSSTQVAAIAPSTLPPGTHSLILTFNSRASQPWPVPVVQTDFGIFTRNSAGYGQAAAQTVLTPSGAIQTLGLSSSVRPGEPIVLYGTGLGAIAGAPDDGPPGAHRTAVPVEIVIGGKVVAPDYAGRSPAIAGLDQINFTAPNDLNAGCYVPVGVRANRRLSNVVSVPVTRAGRACEHPFGISNAALEKIDSGGSVVLTLALMERQSSSASGGAEGAGIGFAEMVADHVEAFVDPNPDPDDASGTPGTCAALNNDPNRTIPMRPRVVNRPRYLDAGNSVRLSGPSYATDLPRTPGSGYGANVAGLPGLPASVLRAGPWTYAGPGGADIGSFRITVDLPEPLRWTNRQERIDPRAPLRIDWAGGGTELIRITLSAGSQGPEGRRFNSFVCTAKAQDGSFTIPVATLATLPPGGSGGIILSQRTTKNGFEVPIVRGGSADGSQFQLVDQTSGPIQLLP